MPNKKLLVVLLGALAFPGGASSAAGTACTVTPNPVVLGTDAQFTVSASGAIPGVYYEVTDQQKGHHKTDEARVWVGAADDTGNLTAVIPAHDGSVNGDGDPYSLWPGDVSVKVVRWRAGGSPGGGQILLSTCSFTVT